MFVWLACALDCVKICPANGAQRAQDFACPQSPTVGRMRVPFGPITFAWTAQKSLSAHWLQFVCRIRLHEPTATESGATCLELALRGVVDCVFTQHGTCRPQRDWTIDAQCFGELLDWLSPVWPRAVDFVDVPK